MKTNTIRLALLAFSLLFSGSVLAQQSSFDLTLLGTYKTGIFDEGAAEISAYDPGSKRLFFTNADANTIVILDLSDPSNPAEVSTIDLDTYGGGVNSVDVYNGIVAVAVEADPKTDPGAVVFFDKDGTFISSVQVGALPDMLTFTPDGSKVVVANEGEPSDDYTIDPEGSISIIDVSGDLSAVSATEVTTADFTSYNAQKATLIADGVRIFGPNASVAQDIEPEYITVSEDGSMAYATLQENNAIAVINLTTGVIDDIYALGYIDHSLTGNELDASDDDDKINIQNWPVRGLFMPDAIASFEVGGTTYLVTANEGDAREYEYENSFGNDTLAYAEEARVEDIELDPSIFTNAAELQNDTTLGRLNITTALADTNANGQYQTLYSFGTRSFTIWNAGDGSRVFDSGSQFEMKLAELIPDNFNSDNTENGSFDSRSDAKGPEPEAVTIATYAGKIYAMIGLERVGGIMVYDVTDPMNPEYVTYSTSRDFSIATFTEDDIEELDDLNDNAGIAAILSSVVESGPESITFIKQGASTSAKPLFVVSNEITGTITVYEADIASDAAPLFFSEYGEGSSNNKYLEIYNPTEQIVSLSEYAFPNGNNTVDIPGSFEFWNYFPEGAEIAPGDVYVIAHPSADAKILAEADFTWQYLSNGDDGYALVYGNEDNYQILDIIGELGEDPGSGWDVAGVSNGTQDHVLVRKEAVVNGNPAPLGSFGTDADNSEWVVLENENWKSLGKRELNPTFSLTILHNNDGESQLINAGSGDLANYGGVARFKTLADQLKAEAVAEGRGVIMLTSGDNFLPGPEFNVGQENVENGGDYYDAIALNAIGYDAFAIGNHDFDFGPDVLEEFISQLGENAPFISANLDFSGEAGLQAQFDNGLIAKSTILYTNGDSVGIVGATTPSLPFISSPRNVEVSSAVADSVQKQVDLLTAKGINKIILISHLQSIKEDSALAAELSDVDVMIAGGGDELLANEGDLMVPGDEVANAFGPYPLLYKNADDIDVPVVTTTGNYKYIGKLSLEFDIDGNLISVLNDKSGPVRVSGVGDDAVAENAVVKTSAVDPVIAGLEALDQNIIGTSAVVLNGVRGDVRTKETNLGNLIADALLWQAKELASTFAVAVPDVALQNGGGIRNDSQIPAGNISELTTFDILPFSNFTSVVPNISASQFKEIMENAVSRVENVDGRFAQIAGFTFEYDPQGTAQILDADANVTTAGSRIITLTLDDGTEIVSEGEVVSGAPAVSIATINFSASGGDQYPFRGAAYTTLGVTYQQTLANFITSSGALNGTITSEDYPVGGEDRITVFEEMETSNEPNAGIPERFALKQNYPNPFNPTTQIAFDLPETAEVRLSVFDMLGRKVTDLVNERMSAGTHSVQFDASALSSGMYIYRIEAGSFSKTQKMMLIK
ncbi:choice-of-anchor I family protein [Gracilimonas sp.]|uniref:choice-of-anchor I family protein n=1 Tax=Gracilimonas sp. TaxID=1974203 RepID=UPI0032EC887B